MHTNGRKSLKTIFLITLVVSLMGATAAMAQRGMGGGMGKRWMMNLTPEQASQVFDLKEKFRNDTAELRKNMMVKGAELRQLWKAEQPDEKAIQAKVKELTTIRGQFMEKAVAQRLAMKKLVPTMTMSSCPMMGPGGKMGPGGCPPGQGLCPAPGQGKGPGAGLMPVPEIMVDAEENLDLEISSNQEVGW